MKKVLIAMLDNDEEITFHNLLNLFEEKQQVQLADNFFADVLKYTNIEINSKYRQAKCNGISVELTNFEFNILYLLASHPKQVFSKKQIYEQVWNEPCLGAEDNVVSLIHRIRKKIEPNPARPVYILTVWGWNINLAVIWENRLRHKSLAHTKKISSICRKNQFSGKAAYSFPSFPKR